MSEVKALFIGAHIDECENGCGGMARLLVNAGVHVKFLNVATFLHDPPAPDVQAAATAQSDAAAKVLGVEKEISPNEERAALWVADAEKIASIRQKIEEYAPDLLFIQWPRDNHVEHMEVARASYHALVQAACHIKVKEVYAFEAGVLQTFQYFVPDFAVNIDSVMPTVEESLMCFSQNRANGKGLCEDKRTVAHLRGMNHGCQYAEAYKIIKFPDGGDDFLVRQLLPQFFRWSGRMQYPAFGREFF